MTATHAMDTWDVLAADASSDVARFDPSTLAELPSPARRLLSAAISDGSPLATTVELSMRGRIKLGVWLPFTARQILRAGVGFVWEPIVGGRVIRFVGADSFGPSGGRMEFRFHDRIPVVRTSGPDVDRSAAGRLAAETVVWLPQALTPQSGAAWRAVDSDRAIVLLPGPEEPVPVEVTVDEHGRVTALSLERWRDSATPPGPAPFGGSILSTLEVDGVHLAASGAVGWDWGTPDQDAGLFFEYQLTSARFLGVDSGAG